MATACLVCGGDCSPYICDRNPRYPTPIRDRASIVAFLRAKANAPHPSERGVPSLSPAGRGLLLLMADAIERGEDLDNTGI